MPVANEVGDEIHPDEPVGAIDQPDLTSSPLRIGIVSLNAHPFAPCPPGHVARQQHNYVARLALALAQGGHPVTVHTVQPAAGTLETYDAVALDELGHDATPDASCVDLLASAKRQSESLSRAWSDQAPDVVHAHSWHSGVAAQLAARELGVPVVQTFYGLAAAARELAGQGAPQDRRDRLHVAAAVARASDGVIALSSADVEALVRLGVGRSRIRLVPAGIDPALVPSSVPAPEPVDRLRVLALHTLEDTAGLDDLRWAADRVADIDLTIGWVGPDEAVRMEPPRGEVEAAHTSVRPDGAGIFDGVDAVAILSERDDLVSLALRAMAVGRAVIGVEGCAVGDAVVDHVTGLLVRPGDRDSLTRALRSLAISPCDLEAMGQAAHDRVATRYPWQRIAEESLAALVAAAS